MAQLQIEACNFMKILNKIAGGVADVVGKTSEILYLCPVNWQSSASAHMLGTLTELLRRTNIQIFDMVLDLQHQVTHIPGQVNRQQLVYFQDALGYSYNLDLVCINSKRVRMANIEQSSFSRTNNGSTIIRHSRIF